MHDFYDRLENRTPAAREAALFRDLAHVIAVSKSRVPALRAQLKGVDVSRVRSRSDLAKIPIRRRADLIASQADAPPFGGFVATRPAALAQMFAGPGALLSPAGHAKDWWCMARALYAAGLRKGASLLNTMSYDLVPFGHMVDAGARAIGCPVVPAGNAAVADVAAAAASLLPTFFCGAPERLRQLLNHAENVGSQTTSLKRALLVGTLKPGLRHEIALRGIAARGAFLLPEAGVIAYETATDDVLTLVENVLLEIVDPDTGQAVAEGQEGEIVVSRINLDFPLLRYGTGLISSVVGTPSECGRTNVRLRMPRPPTQASLLQLAQIRERHPELNFRLSRTNGLYHLQVEHRHDEPTLKEKLGETLHAVMRQQGHVEIVSPGSLRDDDGSLRDDPCGS